MFKPLLLLLLFCNPLLSRDYSKPPSLALRNEVSFVSQVTLDSIQKNDSGYLSLHVSPINDIHNQSTNKIVIRVSEAIAKNLKAGNQYIIAYQTHHKVKENGISKFKPNTNGAKLMNVDGAKPAIFKSNKKLLKQFENSPQMAQSKPQEFIENIILGMQETDDKIQDFFVRELINWPSLHPHITKYQFKKLLQIFNTQDLSIASLTAFLETQKNFKNSLGIESMSIKINNQLMSFPVQLEASSQYPSFVLQALKFLQENNFYDRSVISRWLETNIPSITEKALLILNQYEPQYTVELVNKILLKSKINKTSKNVLKRFRKKVTQM